MTSGVSMENDWSDRNPSQKPWWVLVGPTAVGKSEVAERIAHALQTEIIVADSRQIYEGLDIGTGKPSHESRKRVKRHLIDFLPPDRIFSAGAYKKGVEEAIAEMEANGKRILIEGGTGFYLKAVLNGLWEGPPADWSLRARFTQREKDEGEGALHRLLTEVDPVSSQKIHARDLPKIVRALEVYELTGRALSEIHSEHRRGQTNRKPVWVIGLHRDRKDLYRRIDARVDGMMASGLVDEVAGLLASGLSQDLPAMRGLGYRQMVPYILGERSLEESVSILKRDSRRFAKRQLTWFRSDPLVEWLELEAGEEAGETAERIMRLKNVKSML